MADEYKSCEALAYEQAKLLEQDISATDGNTSRWQYFHKSVVGAGIVASLNPNMLLGNYFYLFPAVTIWYYNTFVASTQQQAHEEEIRKRLETLEILMKQNRCNEGNH